MEFVINLIETVGGFLVYTFGLDRLIRLIQRKLGYAPLLMYHSVSNRNASMFHRGLYRHGMVLELNPFHKQIEYLSKNYIVLPLRSYVAKLRNNNSLKDNIAAITFDDGFRDFLENALPILEKYKCASTVFLVGNCLLNQSSIWLHELYELEEICREKGINPVPEILNNVPEILILNNVNIETIHRSLIYSNNETRKKVLAVLNRLAFRDEKKERPLPYLRASEIAPLISRGVFFGAHTMNHYKTATLSPDELANEVRSSIHLITLFSGQKDVTFAYPFGGPDSWDDRIAAFFSELNVLCGCTSREGLNSRKGINPFKLNRIDVSYTKNFYSFIFRVIGLRAAIERIVEKPYYLLLKAKSSI